MTLGTKPRKITRIAAANGGLAQPRYEIEENREASRFLADVSGYHCACGGKATTYQGGLNVPVVPSVEPRTLYTVSAKASMSAA